MSGDIALGGDAAAHSIPKSGVRPSVPHFFPGFLVLLPPTEIRDSPLAGRLPRDWRLLRRAALPQYHQSASSCCSRAATVRRRAESQYVLFPLSLCLILYLRRLCPLPPFPCALLRADNGRRENSRADILPVCHGATDGSRADAGARRGREPSPWTKRARPPVAHLTPPSVASRRRAAAPPATTAHWQMSGSTILASLLGDSSSASSRCCWRGSCSRTLPRPRPAARSRA